MKAHARTNALANTHTHARTHAQTHTRTQARANTHARTHALANTHTHAHTREHTLTHPGVSNLLGLWYGQAWHTQTILPASEAVNCVVGGGVRTPSFRTRRHDLTLQSLSRRNVGTVVPLAFVDVTETLEVLSCIAEGTNSYNTRPL